MRFLTVVFLLSTSLGFSQEEMHVIACPPGGKRVLDKAYRISETPEKLQVEPTDSTSIGSLEIPVTAKPIVLLNGQSAQSTLEKLPTQLLLKASNDSQSSMYFPVNYWQIIVNDTDRFGGHGSQLSKSLIDAIKLVKRGTILIEVSYFSESGQKTIKEIFEFNLSL